MNIKSIWEARTRISSLVKKTPLLHSRPLSEIAGVSVYLKLETLHDVGAFKVRGAANKILSLSKEQQQTGVTTYSTGNHGLSVAYIAQKMGLQATICVSSRVPKAKIDMIQQFGADLYIDGHGQDDAAKNCYRLQSEQGLTVIEPFDDCEVIAGQGTIGLEILEELPSVGTIVVPLSGGGLLSGIGLAVKQNHDSVNVLGVSMERSAVMYESLKAGRPIELVEEDTLADSLLGGIGLDNRHTFKMVKQYMDNCTLVSEDAIARSMKYMISNHKLIIEGAAATAVAAILEGQIESDGAPIVLIITGNNVDHEVVEEIIKRGN